MPRHPAAKTLYHLVGARVRQRRQELGLTQAELARRISASRTSVSNLEVGRQHVPLHQLYSVARALDVHLLALLPEFGELADLERVQRSVGGVMKDVPARLERTITELLSEASEVTDG